MAMQNPYNNQYQQGGYQQQQQQQGGYQQGGQQQGGQQNRNSGYDNLAQITIVGRTTKDPESKMIGTSKVASTKVAINHRSDKAGTDFWFVEVWGNEGADSKHNFLVNHVPKGRKVLITGVPELRQQKNADNTYTYYPTIKAVEIIGLDGGQGNSNQGGDQQQQYQQQPPQGQYQPQGGFQQQQPPQGQYPPAQQQFQQAPPQQQQYGAPQGAPGGFPPAPPAGAPQGGFPPNPPGGGYGAPVGAPAGAPNGGFPPAPPQQ